MEKQGVLLLSPQAYKYWAINPAVILGYSYMIVDESDVSEIKASAGYSKFHKIIATNVDFLINEGMLRTRDYKSFVDVSLAKKIFSEGIRILDDMKEPDKILLLTQAYSYYKKYILSKSELVIDNPSLYKSHMEMARLLNKNMRFLGGVKRRGSSVDLLNNKVLLHYIWKVLVSMEISRKMNVNFHDHMEYKIFADKIMKHKIKSVCGGYFSASRGGRMKKVVRYLNHIYRLRFPDFLFLDSGTFKVFLKTKADFENLNKLCRELEQLIRSCDDDSLMKKRISAECAFFTDQINFETERILKLHGRLWCPVDFLGSAPGANFIKEKFAAGKKKEAYRLVKKRLDSQYKWYFCFVELFRDKDFREVEHRLLSSRLKAKDGVMKNWWLMDPDNLPWYVSA